MNLIVGFCKNRGIGLKNALPWHLTEDLVRFKKLTIGDGDNAVIMGRNTWNSLPKKWKPLPKRTNIVLTRTSTSKLFTNNAEQSPDFCFNSIKEATSFYKHPFCKYHYNDVWIIGGAEVYRDSLEKKLVKTVYATYIDKDFQCDAFFPTLPNYFVLESQTPWEYAPEYRYRFQIYQSTLPFSNN